MRWRRHRLTGRRDSAHWWHLARSFASAADKETSRRFRAANSLALRNNELFVIAGAAQHLAHDESGRRPASSAARAVLCRPRQTAVFGSIEPQKLSRRDPTPLKEETRIQKFAAKNEFSSGRDSGKNEQENKRNTTRVHHQPEHSTCTSSQPIKRKTGRRQGCMQQIPNMSGHIRRSHFHL